MKLPDRGRPRFVAVALALWFAMASMGCGSSTSTTTFVVPPGTYQAIEAGEDIEVMPTEVELSVGDELRIVNEDTFTHVLGPYTVRPGETFAVTYTAPGEYPGTCSVNASDKTVIRVT